MTPEEAVRSYVYHPPAEEAALTLHDVDEFEVDGMVWGRRSHRLERWLALTFGALAVFAFGFLIGKSLP